MLALNDSFSLGFEYFEIELNYVSKINLLNIVWSYPPSKYFILGSENKKDYEKLTEVRSFKLENEELIESHAYFEEITFRHEPLLRFLRIIFIEPWFQFYGIFSIKAYSFYHPHLIISGIKLNNEEMCLVYDEMNYIMLKNCMNLLISNENSYLWIIYNDNTIRPLINQSLCIQSDLLKENDQNSEKFKGDLILKGCNSEIQYSNLLALEKIEQKIYKDEFSIRNSLIKSLKSEEINNLNQRTQYYFIDNLKIKLKIMDVMCFTSNPDSPNLIPDLKYINSTSNRLNYEIENILSHNTEKYWASQPFSQLPIIIEVNLLIYEYFFNLMNIIFL